MLCRGTVVARVFIQRENLACRGLFLADFHSVAITSDTLLTRVHIGLQKFVLYGIKSPFFIQKLFLNTKNVCTTRLTISCEFIVEPGTTAVETYTLKAVHSTTCSHK